VTAETVNGFVHLRGFLGAADQAALIEAVAAVDRAAPFFRPTMPNGTAFRIEMTNAGEWGWVSDRQGYRYDRRHPLTGRPWPEPPEIMRKAVVRAAEAALGGRFDPQCWLLNRYPAGTGRLGLHRDEDEIDREQPIVTLSLGADAVFLAGGMTRKDKAARVLVRSGDAVVMGGPARLAYHGVDKVLPTLESAVPGGFRLSITARRVEPSFPLERAFPPS
jgi:alkylated DNA repair protein (DNA oxidative demethylase)